MTGHRQTERPRAAGDRVVHVVARWEARPDTLQEVREVLAELSARSEREPGCRRFTVLESTTHPGRFVLVEEYLGAEGRQAHTRSAHYRTLVLERAVGLLAHREVDAYDVVSGSAGTTGSAPPARS